jgi:hypothetical protein
MSPGISKTNFLGSVTKTIESPHTFHEKKIPTFMYRFTFRRFVVTEKHAEIPRKDSVKSFFSTHIGYFSVHNLAFPKTNGTFSGTAAHVHSARISAYADQLHNVVQTRIGDGSAEALRFQ